ncbi:MAG: amino acid adenylation domain-containing protein [Gemmatimonadota bacterium]
MTDLETALHSGNGSNDSCLFALIRDGITRDPAAVAVVSGDATLSYGALWTRATVLARELQARGVGPDVLVGISVERGLDLPVAILGVVLAGGAYLPLDRGYPAERLQLMLTTAAVRVVVTDGAPDGWLQNSAVDVVRLDWLVHDVARLTAATALGLPHVARSDEALVYALFTSGSTGVPKAIAMHGAPLANLVTWQMRTSAGGRTLQFSPVSFDVHFQEFFVTWAGGDTLVMISEAQRLDAFALLELIEQQQVARIFLPFIALQNLCDAARVLQRHPASLREVLTAGETLHVTPSVEAFFAALPGCVLWNQYGPTETHVVTAHRMEGPPRDWERVPPIGTCIDCVHVHVVDAELRPVAAGDTGELLLGGVAVARGYLADPVRTAARFIDDPVIAGARVYRSGDLGRVRRDGTIEFLGRQDGQLKVRGHRVEIGEIEAALLAHLGVREAAVAAVDDGAGSRRLIAHVVADASPTLTRDLLRDLADRLPGYMVPSAVMVHERLPRTPSGKVERSALPIPARVRPELASAYVAPRSARERQIGAVWQELLGIDDIGIDDDFFALGGHSLLAIRCVAVLRERYALAIPVVKLFEFPTIAALARWSDAAAQSPSAVSAPERDRAPVDAHEPIAIIGMAARFPDAADVDVLWTNLVQGRESITAAEPAPSSEAGALRVTARGVLPHIDRFDAAFFGITPNEAAVTDPQQRQLLEVMWTALEHAGHVPDDRQHIGVFAGTHNNSYHAHHVMAHPDVVERLGAFQVMVANEKDYVATRIAHRMGLTGPALSIHTACSTSLVAVMQAVESLRSGGCDMALAGAASITVPSAAGDRYVQGGMLSADGHCRPFDAKASGTMFSDGIGVVVLKRLRDAERDGDTVFAVIRGGAVNNDGHRKSSFAAPSVRGQADVITAALSDAGVSARSISYVEAHGTATPLGDPIEVEALTQAYRAQTADVGFCAIGSIKSNFGHVTAAAGVAGLIKTTLALRHGMLPATLHFESPNPAIRFDESPFRVQQALTPWTGAMRRAGVSSFGVGGTNAHVIVEEAPAASPTGPARPHQLLTWSARTEQALDTLTARLADAFEADSTIALADAAYVQHLGRRAFTHRRTLVARDARDAARALREGATMQDSASGASSVVLLFPGQGTQFVGMGRSLYDEEPAFRDAFDACADAARPALGADLRGIVYATGADVESAEAALAQTDVAQSALFAVEYATARLLQSWGVSPSVMLGHSLGEWVAATLAGVFTLPAAVRLVALRGQLMQEQPAGSMLAVLMSADSLRPRLDGGLVIAADNAPLRCVVSGPTADIERLAATLTAEQVPNRPLATSRAFHSPMMDAVVPRFRQAMADVTLSSPGITMISSVTGRPLRDDEATDPAYWARQIVAPVLFRQALDTLPEAQHIFVEVGPLETLSTFVRQHGAAAGGRGIRCCASTIPAAPADGDEPEQWPTILGMLATVWRAGVAVDWSAFHAREQRRRIPLPTYPFERTSHWLPATVPVADANRAVSSVVESSVAVSSVAVPVPPAPSPIVAPLHVPMSPTAALRPDSRRAITIVALRTLLADYSGLALDDADEGQTFVEMGLDSLVLTQVALEVGRRYPVAIQFRQLMENYPSLGTLADHVVASLPAEVVERAAEVAVPAPVSPAVTSAVATTTHMLPARDAAPMVQGTRDEEMIRGVIDRQLQLMAMQLDVLRGTATAPQDAPAQVASQPMAVAPAATAAAIPDATSAPVSVPAPVATNGADPDAHRAYDVKKAFGAQARIVTVATDDLTTRQRTALDELTRAYTARTASSKAFAGAHRSHLADPRMVTGFRPLVKELIYPLLVDRSKGARLWDRDGNEYLDALNGFGSNMFGHSPDFVVEALQAQLERGYELGPMPELAGDVARRICAMTGFERAAFCNTGSEAVLGCMRIARTVTGRSLIAIMAGSYHGIFDEVIVRGTRSLRTVPAAPGILPEAVQNVLVLDYGAPETLEILRQRAHELAAVMVEPIQSRHSDRQPVEWLREVREITRQSGSAFIFDEVITGFRLHPRGAQGYFGVQGDLASYGKVIGGGQPIGVIAGTRAWMDALDGGQWQYGDASVPTVGVTYFAGTFVRHPLALAAAGAVLDEMERHGPALQQSLNERTADCAQRANAFFDEARVPLLMKQAGSLWKMEYTVPQTHGDLLFCFLRLRGVHIWEGFPCFMTTAFTEADVTMMLAAIRGAVHDMQRGGFLPASLVPVSTVQSFDASRPPMPGARLGRDRDGNPAWYVQSDSQPNTFVRVSGVELTDGA